ncbi:hypothetical protein BV22DRAFT_907889 [Leucogyrophana mollusca]|uniref:Uncharacterized protein n=1 Tax=Leucogyrophana mollusca TaxID=85980 RepID=A0ACB8AYX0_9AGAM|nr:hypothetical protein BV22DRAFT_907889 [Leucogyrophana mollusca]
MCPLPCRRNISESCAVYSLSCHIPPNKPRRSRGVRSYRPRVMFPLLEAVSRAQVVQYYDMTSLMDSHNLRLTSPAQLVFPQHQPFVSLCMLDHALLLPLNYFLCVPLSMQPATCLPNELSTLSPASDYTLRRTHNTNPAAGSATDVHHAVCRTDPFALGLTKDDLATVCKPATDPAPGGVSCTMCLGVCLACSHCPTNRGGHILL